MSAPAFAQPPSTFDVSGTPPIPFTRTVAVELRKLVDTRSGRWLLIIQAGLIVVASVIVAIAVANQDGSIAFFDFTSIAGGVMSLLLPVLGILSVTSEWSQRTNMTTFTLEPRRSRVVFAKMVATVITAIVSIVVAIAIGAVMTGLASALGATVDWTFETELLAGFLVAQVIGLLIGFAFGTLLLNTPAAIVTYIAYFTLVPGVLAVAAQLMGWFADVRPWIDFNMAQGPLLGGFEPGADVGFGAVDWAQFATSGLLWFVLPLVLGITRMLRAEVK